MTSRWLRALCAISLLAAPLAHAQYSWLDANGTRVFSDRPPPPGTPAAKILKAPKPLSPYAPDAPVPAAAPEKTEKKDKTPTLADRDAEFKKRATQRDEDAKKALEAQQQKAAQAERCQGSREKQAELTSGRRLVRTNASGEQEYLSDDERARQLEKVQRVLAECG